MACRSHVACPYPQALYRFEWQLDEMPFPHARFLVETADARVFVEYLRGSLRFSRSLYTETASAVMRNMDHVKGSLDVYSMDVLILSLAFSSSNEFVTVPLSVLRSFQYKEVVGDDVMEDGESGMIEDVDSNSSRIRNKATSKPHTTSTVIREYPLHPIPWSDGIIDVVVQKAHVQSVLLGNNILFAEEHSSFQSPFRLMASLPSSSLDPLSLELKPYQDALFNAFFHHRTLHSFLPSRYHLLC